MDAALREFILGMPKIELHLHIEGSLEPELAFALAARNGVVLKRKDGTAYENAAELRAAYQFSNLQEFLDIYYQGMSVLLTEPDFYDLTMAYLQKVASQNVQHVEIFFDPQGHTERGVAFATAIEGIDRALQEGKKTLGITSQLIMCFLRHLPEKEAFETLEQAKPYIERAWIHGIGLDSSEHGFPPTDFANIYAAVREAYPHLKRVAHAGEEGPASYVQEALDVLKVDRIDHGNHALDDAALVERLVREGMGLTMCPLSNLRLCHTLDFATGEKLTDLRQHMLKQMLQNGVKVTVNSDDPSYFGGYMNENFIAIAEALHLSRADIHRLAENAIEVSFLPEAEKNQHRQHLNVYIQQVNATAASLLHNNAKKYSPRA